MSIQCYRSRQSHLFNPYMIYGSLFIVVVYFLLIYWMIYTLHQTRAELFCVSVRKLTLQENKMSLPTSR